MLVYFPFITDLRTCHEYFFSFFPLELHLTLDQ